MNLLFRYNTRMTKKVGFVVFVVLCLVFALAGCSKNTSESDLNESVVTIGIAQDFDSLDPHHMQAAGTKEILFNMFEGLVKPTSDGDIIPAVASQVTKSDDGLVYTFTLRENVRFHDGTDVTAKDVLYSFNRRMDGKDSAAQLASLSVVKSVEAKDNKIIITLSQPSNEFLAAVMNVYIIPQACTDIDTYPVGTGPYRFSKRVFQDSLELVRFDEYWGTPGKTDKFIFRILESSDARVLALQSGAVDVVSHLTSDQTKQLDTNKFDILTGSMNLVQALYLNNAVKPFDNILVRQAMCYAVDRKAVIDLAFDGYGIILGTSMFPSFSKYYLNELTNYYEYNPQKAKDLLKEAGYPNGFSMTITVPSNYTPHVNTATVIAEMLRQVGINASIQLVDWGTWLEEVYTKRNYQSTVTGVSSDNMTARKLLERFGSTVGNNFTNYSNSQYDLILKKALNEADDSVQTELYKDLERNLTENAANVYIQDMADLVAVRNGLKGLVFYPLYVLDVSTLYWEQ